MCENCLYLEPHDASIMSATQAIKKLIGYLPDCPLTDEIVALSDTQIDIMRHKIMSLHYGDKQLHEFYMQCKEIIESEPYKPLPI